MGEIYFIGVYTTTMSNNYAPWWNTTITLYSKYMDSQTGVIQWFRHVISGCFWQDVGFKSTINQTVLETNAIVCRIPEQGNFLSKAEWVQLPNDQLGNYLSISVGDILIPAEVDDEIDEYTSGKRANDLIAKYKELDGCMVADRVSINVGGGRNNPHYNVRGI